MPLLGQLSLHVIYQHTLDTPEHVIIATVNSINRVLILHNMVSIFQSPSRKTTSLISPMKPFAPIFCAGAAKDMFPSAMKSPQMSIRVVQ